MLKHLRAELKKLRARPDADKVTSEHAAAAREVAQAQQDLASAESKERRKADLAEMKQLQALVDESKAAFDAAASTTAQAWGAIEDLLRETEQIRHDLMRARELGHTVEGAPAELRSIEVPESLIRQFPASHGRGAENVGELDGMAYLKARFRDGALGQVEDGWLYGQGLRLGLGF